PGCLRAGHTDRGAAFATAVRMVTRVHHSAADLGPTAAVPRAAGLAELHERVLDVAHLADGGDALDADAPHFTAGQAEEGVLAFLGHELGARAGAADHLAAAAGR